MTTNEELVGKARAAGQHAGSATQMLRDAIRDAWAAGCSKFDDAVIADMRAAFRDACAAAGKTKNAGSTMFADAWDSLIGEGLGLEERKRKGAGRNGKSKDKGESEGETDGNASSDSKVDKGEIARSMLAKAGIDAELVALCVKAFAGLANVAKDKTHGGVAKDARHALKQAGNKLNRILAIAGAELSSEDAKAASAEAAPMTKHPMPKSGKSSKASVEARA